VFCSSELDAALAAEKKARLIHDATQRLFDATLDHSISGSVDTVPVKVTLVPSAPDGDSALPANRLRFPVAA